MLQRTATVAGESLDVKVAGGLGPAWLWLFNVAEWTPTAEDFAAALGKIEQPQERTRILRYHKGALNAVGYPHHLHDDPKCFVIARLALQQIYPMLYHRGDGVPPPWETLVLGRTEEGRPCLPHALYGRQRFDVNASHAGTIVAVAAHEDALIGVDVMPIELSPPSPTFPSKDVADFFDCLRDNFTPLEWEWIRLGKCAGVESNASDDQDGFHPLPFPLSVKRFFVLWTLKEAYIKAIGVGLSFNLQSAEFRFVPAAGMSTLHSESFFDTNVVREEALPSQFPSLDGSHPAMSAGAKTGPSPRVVMFLQGRSQEGVWSFRLFEDRRSNTVGAIAFGPRHAAGTPSFRATVAPCFCPQCTGQPRLPHSHGNDDSAVVGTDLPCSCLL